MSDNNNTNTAPEYCMYDLGEVLQGAGHKSGKLVPGFTAPSPEVPASNPDYIWPGWTRDIWLWLVHSRDPLYITGPTGAGKTAAIKQAASLLQMPVFETTGHARLETPELVGHYVLAGTGTVWQDGPLTKAMRQGGFFLLNEIDLLDPSTAAGLNTVLDGSPLLVPETNEVIKPHPAFRFVATANTVGGGDISGLYQGTLRMNAAFMDRFTVLVADYLPKATEATLVSRKFGNQLAPEVVNVIMDVSTLVRSLYKGDTENLPEGLGYLAQTPCALPLSTRSVLRWCEWAVACAPMAASGTNVLEYSMMRAFGYRAEPPMQTALKEILQRVSGNESTAND